MESTEQKTAVITGTGGLGFQAALALSKLPIKVILAGRNPNKGEEAVTKIQTEVPDSSVKFESLDLASLKSIRSFAQRVSADFPQIDILINNAGVMAPPARQLTQEGFELQFGTNHLGHFALTQQLLPLLRQSGGARVVSVTSLAYKGTKFDFEDLQGERSYVPFKAYSQSKLAQLVFAIELQRRSERYHWNLMSNAAHPGFAATDLFNNQSGGFSRNALNVFSKHVVQPILGQSAGQGALPSIYAATAPRAKGGELYGPDGLFEMKGAPRAVNIQAYPRNEECAAKLWEVSEQLTRLSFPTT